MKWKKPDQDWKLLSQVWPQTTSTFLKGHEQNRNHLSWYTQIAATTDCLLSLLLASPLPGHQISCCSRWRIKHEVHLQLRYSLTRKFFYTSQNSSWDRQCLCCTSWFQYLNEDTFSRSLSFPSFAKLQSLLSLVQPTCFDKSIYLLSCELLVILFLNLVEGDDFLGTIDNGFYINIAFCKPVCKLLHLCSCRSYWLLSPIFCLGSRTQSCMCRTCDVTSRTARRLNTSGIGPEHQSKKDWHDGNCVRCE